MRRLFKILNESGFNCSLEKDDVIKVNHFPREYIVIERLDDRYAIKNGLLRHVALVLVLTTLLLVMRGNVFASGLIAVLSLYSFLQAIRITIITSSINNIIASYLSCKRE
ncbi:hypothetical protein [Thalassotalea mangrovi]|uniref:Uncharacterized protein n=1 Tax=Thalassotalea mangrovi TaxID=2572245 RepID=A0A4U1B666_9GAMM|nr:hypothetical protein [Thalassotalea mangrovi]TKB45632.1 hypothetical protein E8M12_07630 [Thalassotalea mangrovi]